LYVAGYIALYDDVFKNTQEFIKQKQQGIQYLKRKERSR